MFPESWKENAELIRRVKECNSIWENQEAVIWCEYAETEGYKDATVDEFIKWCKSQPYPAPVKSGYYWAKINGKTEFEPVHVVMPKGEDDIIWLEVVMFGLDAPYDMESIAEWGSEIVKP